MYDIIIKKSLFSNCTATKEKVVKVQEGVMIGMRLYKFWGLKASGVAL